MASSQHGGTNKKRPSNVVEKHLMFKQVKNKTMQIYKEKNAISKFIQSNYNHVYHRPLYNNDIL